MPVENSDKSSEGIWIYENGLKLWVYKVWYFNNTTFRILNGCLFHLPLIRCFGTLDGISVMQCFRGGERRPGRCPSHRSALTLHFLSVHSKTIVWKAVIKDEQNFWTVAAPFQRSNPIKLQTIEHCQECSAASTWVTTNVHSDQHPFCLVGSVSYQLERRKGKLSLGERTGGQWQMSHSRVKNKPGNYFKNIFVQSEQEEILQNQVGPQTFKRVIEHCSQCRPLSHPTRQGEAEWCVGGRDWMTYLHSCC